MPKLEFNDLGKFGLVRDQPPYQLPPEVLSYALNVRTQELGIARMLGWEQALGTPLYAPHFHMPLSTSAQDFWLYASLTKAAVIDGPVHTDITRTTGGDYNAGATRDWNGTIIGGIPILNNGADVPQFWASPNAATKLANLTNWPSTLRAKVLRSFGPHLVGINITKGGTNYPHMVKWSAAVTDPGTLPSTWDESDQSKDAGEYELVDVNSGVLVDALPLQARLFLYKEGSIWAIRYIGGRFVFSFENFLETVGILAPRCVCVGGDGRSHIVATQDDIIIHNGATASSILDKRMKRSLFSAIDVDGYINSFLFSNPAFNEIWFCYPSSGQMQPNSAVIWNYKENTLTEADGITFRNAIVGAVETASNEQWNEGTDVWDEDTGKWSDVERRKIVLAGTDASKFYVLDKGLTRDGVAFTATIQREGLAIIGKKRDGSPIVDHEILKFIRGVWPKIMGGPVRIRIGYQSLVDGAIAWGDYLSFNPEVDIKVDTVGTARAIAFEISTTTAVNWRVDGFKLDLELAGTF